MMVAVVGFLAYLAFVAVPLGGPGEGDFAPGNVAAHEVALWQSAHAGEEVGTFVSATQFERELHRYSWFRAAQAGFHVARAATTFASLRGRYERVLPDLEAAATIQRGWTGADIEPASVARAQLNWWVTRRMPNLDTLDQVAPLVQREFELRYRLRPGAASDAAARMAEAALLFDHSPADPDIVAITKLLTDAYQALRRSIVQARTPGRD